MHKAQGVLGTGVKEVTALADMSKSHIRSRLISRADTEVEPVLGDPARLLQLVMHAEEFGTWRLDVRSQAAWWSPTVFRIHGLPPYDEPITLEDAVRLYHPDDAKTVAWLVQQAIVKRSGYSFVLRLNRADGQQRLVESIATVEIDEDGRVTSLFGLFRDVTDRLKEHDLSNSRIQLVKSIIQHSPAPTIVVDRGLRWLQANPAWMAFHGLADSEALVGRPLYDVMPDFTEAERDEHWRALSGEVVRHDAAPQSENGLCKPASVICPWRSSTGRVGGLVIMITALADQTEQDAVAAQ